MLRTYVYVVAWVHNACLGTGGALRGGYSLAAMGVILLLPAEALWRPDDRHASVCQLLRADLAADGAVLVLESRRRAARGRTFDPLGLLQSPLHAGQEVEIVIDHGGRLQQRLLNVFGWVAFPAALRPLLVSFVTRQRACLSTTSGTLVLERSDIAANEELISLSRFLFWFLERFTHVKIDVRLRERARVWGRRAGWLIGSSGAMGMLSQLGERASGI